MEESIEYNEHEFFPKLFEVLDSAVGLAMIRSGYLRLNRVKQMAPCLRRNLARGLTICMFFQDPRLEKTPNPAYIKEFDETVALLVSMGVHVNIRPYIHHKIIIVDDNTSFTGSLNTGSWGGITEENMTFWPNSKRKATEIKLKYGIDCCVQCAKNKPPGTTLEDNLKTIGAFIAKRRKSLGMTQEELAKHAKVSKSTVSRFEKGIGDLKFSTILLMERAMALENRSVPNFMARGIDDQLKHLQ